MEQREGKNRRSREVGRRESVRAERNRKSLSNANPVESTEAGIQWR